MPDLSKYGPWAVIAGGSEGVGAEFATQLADEGFNLVLIARKPGPLEETAAAVRERGVEVRTVSVDLTAADAVSTITDQTADVEVGLLIYNAGANAYGHEFLNGELAGFGTVIDLNITAMLGLVHHYGRLMRERKRGGIVLIGSLSGYLGHYEQTIYSGVKAFSRVFAEGLWLELREHNVDVLEYVLGVTRTPAMERAGLNFDMPGLVIGEPKIVAAEALAKIADGPVVIADGNQKIAEVQAGPDRHKIVAGSHERMKRLINRG